MMKLVNAELVPFAVNLENLENLKTAINNLRAELELWNTEVKAWLD